MKINTDSEFYNTERGYIRSSSLKSFHACSWLYYTNYILKLPQDSNNDGARTGNVCHSIFECMLKLQRNKTLYNQIIADNSIKGVAPVARLAKKLIKRNELSDNEMVFKKIDKMLLVGFKTDFFVEGGKVISAEYRFKYRNESPNYFIIGTIDRIAIRGDTVVIDDFKSSKVKYKGEDKESNTQALLYSLYAKKKWPDKKPIVRFIFLQFPDDPILEVQFNDDTLMGFEYYLESIGMEMDKFSESDAVARLAAYQDIPRDGSFAGKLVCGFAKTPTQMKKDGTKMFACSSKFPFNFFKVTGPKGQFITSVFRTEDYQLKEGETFEKVTYQGCPFYNKKIFI